MNFKKWVKSIQTAGYNGARTVLSVSYSVRALAIYRTRAIITRGLYTFYPLFEVHLCTVTFGLMYGYYSRAVSNQERVIVACLR